MRAREFVNEEINPDIRNPSFSHRQRIGDFICTAKTRQGWRGDNYLNIKIASKDNPSQPIGEVDFKIWGNDESGYLESIDTVVNRQWRKKGLASTLYAYARMLGNTILPSKYRTPAGKAMWTAWEKADVAKHLIAEDHEAITNLRQLYSKFNVKHPEQYAAARPNYKYPVNPYSTISDTRYIQYSNDYDLLYKYFKNFAGQGYPYGSLKTAYAMARRFLLQDMLKRPKNLEQQLAYYLLLNMVDDDGRVAPFFVNENQGRQ